MAAVLTDHTRRHIGGLLRWYHAFGAAHRSSSLRSCRYHRRRGCPLTLLESARGITLWMLAGGAAMLICVIAPG